MSPISFVLSPYCLVPAAILRSLPEVSTGGFKCDRGHPGADTEELAAVLGSTFVLPDEIRKEWTPAGWIFDALRALKQRCL